MKIGDDYHLQVKEKLGEKTKHGPLLDSGLYNSCLLTQIKTMNGNLRKHGHMVTAEARKHRTGGEVHET